MNSIDWLAWTLVVVGAVNWGLIGVSNLNLVSTLFGGLSSLNQVLYILMGLSGLYMIWMAVDKR